MGLPIQLGARLLILLPIAFLIYLIIDSQDKNVRMLAIVGLIVLEQVREWLLVSAVRGLAKGNKD